LRAGTSSPKEGSKAKSAADGDAALVVDAEGGNTSVPVM
jgi:hypothetical protein